MLTEARKLLSLIESAMDKRQKPKKILVFSLTYLPLVGGAEIAIKEITRRISPEDYVFDLITLRLDSRLPKFEKMGNVDVYRVGPGKRAPEAGELLSFPMYLIKVFYPIMAFFKAVSLDRKIKYDCLWSMMSYMGFPAVLFRMFYRDIPYVLSLQEGDNIDRIKGRKRIRAVGFLFRKVFTTPDVVQTISSYLSDFAGAMGYKGRAKVIPNAVDVSFFGQRRPEGELKAVRKKLGVSSSDKIIITTSRLVGKNAVDDVIKSLSYLPGEVKFLVLGAGPDLKELAELAQKLDLETRVLFLGHIENEEIPPYLQISNIFIRPSLSEGMGNSFIEAMAAGAPVIATKVGGITDFLFDPKDSDKPTGVFANIRDPRDISKKIKFLLADKELCRRISQNAKELVAAKYDWNLSARRMKEEVFDIVA